MREIKFDAHYKGHIYMLTEIMWSDGTAYLFGYPEFPEGATVSLDEIDLRQYTGLNDKNGQEIYEGDILEYTEDDCNELQYLTTRRAVTFANGAFHFGVVPHVSKVIGNIYENPELLR